MVRDRSIGQAVGLADDLTDPAAPSHPPEPPGRAAPDQASPTSERSWRGLVVGLAIAVAVMLLLLVVAVAAARRGGSGDKAPSTIAGGATVSTRKGQPASSTPGTRSPATEPPPSTRLPTPTSIVASDDRRIVVLDQSGGAAPRPLFDLGPSTASDQVPPVIGGVSLSSDSRFVYFDVVGNPVAGSLNRVPAAGGAKEDLGAGVAPMPSPDGSALALIEAPEPDVPATLVLRPQDGGASRRFGLGEGTCGNIAWAPSRREVAVDLCSGGEPVTVAIVDVASGGIRRLAPPEGTTWSIPAFRADGTLTLVEQRDTDAAVVTLTADRSAVAATVLRRPSTSINSIDWSAGGDLLVCDVDGIVVVAIGGTKPQQVATGYTSAAW